MLHRSLAILAAAAALMSSASADEFTKADLDLWQKEYLAAVDRGRAVFTDPKLGTNGVVCAQCHPNGSNIHPETYPKFQKQIGSVAPLWVMINWCIRNPLEGAELAADDPRMVEIQTYITHERRGVKLDPGKH